MKKQIIYVLAITMIFLFSHHPAAAQETYTGGVALKGEEILSTPAFVCDGSLHPADYVATQNMKIFQARIWAGMTLGGQGDFFYILKNYTTGAILVQNSWDHYAEPTGLGDNIDDLSWAPNYMLVLAGETIRLNGKCSVGSGGSGPLPMGQLSAVIWYIND